MRVCFSFAVNERAMGRMLTKCSGRFGEEEGINLRGSKACTLLGWVVRASSPACSNKFVVCKNGMLVQWLTFFGS